RIGNETIKKSGPGLRHGHTVSLREAEEELNIAKLTSRRNDTSLQDTAATTMVTRAAEGGKDVTMRAVLLRLIDTAVSAFNLAFLTVTETAATS
ncbi:hypothetical protein BDBG_02977, partial [Blastomyces gilchristii SLH14081]